MGVGPKRERGDPDGPNRAPDPPVRLCDREMESSSPSALGAADEMPGTARDEAGSAPAMALCGAPA
jgi:hypothetical protein